MKKIILNPRINLYLLACFLCLPAYAQQSFEWVNSFGGTASDQGWGVAADDLGYSYATGLFNGTAYFEKDSVVSAGVADACVARLDPDGKILWVKRMGGTGADWGRGIAVDPSGNAYCTGDFNLTAGFGSFSLTAKASNDIFVTKIDASGTILWAKSFGGKSADIGWAIDTDDQGFVYVTGSFGDTAFFENHTIISSGGNDIFVTKLDTSGNVIWVKALGGNATEIPRGIAAGKDQNIYLTGYFSNTTTSSVYFDTIGPITARGNMDIFIAKLDTSGHAVWVRQMGGGSQDQGFGVAVDHLGNVFGTGMFQSTAYFGTDTFVSYTNEIYVTKYDKEGNYKWAKQFGSTSGDYGQGIAVDLAGNAYATGYYRGTVDFDPGTDTFNLRSNGSANEIFILKLKSDGSFGWAKSMGGTGADAASSITVNRSGHVFIAGLYTGTADFDPGTDTFNLISRNNSNDIFIAKLSCRADSSYMQVETVCGEDFIINGHSYGKDGTYTEILPGSGGCDSVVTFDLTLLAPGIAEITIDEFTLGTTIPFVSYQWLLNGSLIAGATNSTYEVQENGEYQVIVVDSNGCVDTSGIYRVSNVPVAINHVGNSAGLIRVYPNPANHTLHIISPAPVHIALYGLDGRVLLKSSNVVTLPVKELANGAYFLYISDQEERLIKVVKIIKQ